MRLFKVLEERNFQGIDVNLEISLLEYGLLIQEKKNEIQVIYGVGMTEEGYNKFSIAMIEKTEIDEKITENWFDKKGFFKFIGDEEEVWKKSPIVIKLSDLLNYYGHQNIIGDGFVIHYNLTELNRLFH